MRSLVSVTITVMMCTSIMCACNNTPAQPVAYTYIVEASYPHDPEAFTQGLVYTDSSLYEGTGLVGKSSLRRVDLETGEVQQVRDLPEPFFGEGITLFKDSIYQLTWKSHTGFVYDKNTFDEKRQFSYTTEGWGLTHDGKRLIMSDGTARLYYLDPQSLEVTGYIDVQDAPEEIGELRLNELEYVRGEIYANMWPTNYIVRINPSNGRVRGWVDMSGILDTQEGGQKMDVLNGIAYDARHNRLFVTGKLWPWLFEIKLERQE
jgi:glutamine cyclotransferase